MTRAQVQAAIEALGGSLEVDEGGRRESDVYQAVAPRGHHWVDTGGPHLVAARYASELPSLMARVKCGVEPCTSACDCWEGA